VGVCSLRVVMKSLVVEKEMTTWLEVRGGNEGLGKDLVSGDTSVLGKGELI